MGIRTPRMVDKPWGHEEIFAETESYVGKILAIRAGQALSLQYHEVKDETLRVLDGELDHIDENDFAYKGGIDEVIAAHENND